MSFTNQQPWAGVAGAPDGIVMVRTANFMTLLDGTPVDVLAGQSGTASVPPDMVWDWMGKVLYVCTQSSANPLSTVWTELAFVGPFVGTDLSADSLNVSGSIVDQGTLLVEGLATFNTNVSMGDNLTVAGGATIAGPTTVGPLNAIQGGTLGGTFTGSPVFNFPLNLTQPIALANNVFITSADTTGAYRRLIGTDSTNQSFFQNAGGGNTGFLNQAGTAWLLVTDNVGNVQVPAGSLYSGGSITTPATVRGGYVQSTGNLDASGSSTIGGNLTVNGGVYPNSILNIGGYSGFDLALFGGAPTLEFASNQFIQFQASGSNLVYYTQGSHYFEGGPVVATGAITGGAITGSSIHSTGNAQVDGSLTTNNNVQATGQLLGGSMNVAGPASVGGTLAVSSHGLVGAEGWYYAGTGGSHAFQFWLSGASVICRVDNGSDVNIGTISDARFKTDIVPSTFDGLAAIRSVPLFGFQWKDGPATPIGFVAQELAKVFPEAVDDTGNNLIINTNAVLAALCAAVQQLATRLT